MSSMPTGLCQLSRSRALCCQARCGGGASNNSSNKNNALIGDAAGLQRKIENIRRGGGLSKLQVCAGGLTYSFQLTWDCSQLWPPQVIADFDMTLTKYLVNGRRGQSSHSLLNQGNPEYDLKRQQLFDHYYPLEISPAIPLLEKSKLMEEWWEKTHALLVEGGLNRQAIVQSVANAVIEFRDGVDQLFQLLQENCVPVLIFSAGLSDIIEEVMHQKLQHKFPNVRVVSNRMEFDSDGSLLGFKGKTIHVLNKNEHALVLSNQMPDADMGTNMIEQTDVYALKMRTNVLLLGDHIGDLGMSDGMEYENRISVGFLNENVDAWLDEYRKNFDIVLPSDETVNYVVDLVQQFAAT